MGINKEDGWSKQGRLELQAARAATGDHGSSAAADDAQLALEEMAAILERSPGYLRIGRRRGGGFWCRWKWTDGPLAGRYVFCGSSSLGQAIQEAMLHASEVESGKRAAALDQRL